MKNISHTLIFAVVLGAICSALIVGAGLFTAPYRIANEKADQISNTLAALDAPIPPDASTDDLLLFFEQRMREITENGITIYEYIPEGATEPAALAVPFTGQGVWGPIEGVLALEPDRVTIRGVRFYRQEETPGLGGEIASERFQAQFQGKRLVSREGEPGFKVLRAGAEKAPNAIDAITGATMTSDRVGIMIDGVAKELFATQ